MNNFLSKLKSYKIYTVSKNQFGFFLMMSKRYMRSGSEGFRSIWAKPGFPKTKLIYVYLIIAVLAGSFIRLWGLDRQSLWFDEIVTAMPYMSQFRQSFSMWIFNDFHPPLYQIFLYFWTEIFGNSEAALRFPSALAGILSLFFMYFLGKKILNKHIAASATILLAFSSAAIVYSQEARGYSFLLMLSTISTLLWLDLVNKMHSNKARNTDFFIYGAICLLTMYTHYFGVAFISFQFAYLFLIAFRIKNYFKQLFISVWIIFCIFIPWFVYHYFRVKEIKTAIDWIPRSNMGALINLIDFIFNKKLIILLFIPFFASIKKIINNTSYGIKNIRLDSTVLCLSYLSILPIVIVFIIGRFIPVFFPRYFIIILPSSYLLIAALISYNDFFSKLRGNAYVFMVSLLSLLLFLFVKGNNIMNFNTFYSPYKQQWRETVKYVADNYDDKSIICADRDPAYYTYYLSRFLKNKMIYIRYYTHGGHDLYMDKIDPKKFNRVFIFSNFNRLDKPAEMSLLRGCYNLKYQNNTGVILYDCTLNPPNRK